MSGRSAIVEDGDGEMTIPSVLQPVTEIFSPILNLLSVPLLSNDTWFTNSVLQGSGITAVQTTPFPTFSSGRWSVEINFVVHFAGTSNINSQNLFSLVDPNGSVQNIFEIWNFNFNSLTCHGKYEFLFNRDGWFFQHSTAALVLGDIVGSHASVYARRIF